MLLSTLGPGCGGTSSGTDTSGSGPTGTGDSTDAGDTSDTGDSTGTGGSTGGGDAPDGWNLATGANSADLVAGTSFAYTVSIALDTLTVTSSSTDLVVGTTSGGATPISLGGSPVITVAESTYGLTVTSDLPDGLNVELALSGTYAGSITLYTGEAIKLRLDGVTIASPDGPAVNVQSGERTFVVLASGTTSRLSDSTTYSTRYLSDNVTAMDLKAAFFSEGPIVIGGTGSLVVNGAKKHALASDAHVRLVEGTVTIAAAAKDGIHVNDAFVMDGGALTVTTASGAGKGIKVEGKEDETAPLGFVAVNGGALTVSPATRPSPPPGRRRRTAPRPPWPTTPTRASPSTGAPSPSTFGTPYEDPNTADGDDSLSPEGIEAKSTLTVNGGDLTITTTDDGLNAGSVIVIAGGRTYVKASANDAVDSNGTMTISGGVLVADGASGAEGGLDTDQNTFAVTGGTFIGIGGRNSTPTASACTQNTVSLGNGAAGTLLVVKDASGGVAFAFRIPEQSQAMLLGSPAIATGTSYTVYTGGALGAYGEDFHGLYLGATSHSGGTAGRTFTVSSTVTRL